MRVRTVLAAAGIAAGTVLTATSAPHVALSPHRAVAVVGVHTVATAQADAALAGVAHAAPTAVEPRPATAEASRSATRHPTAKHHQDAVRRHRPHHARHTGHGRHRHIARHHHAAHHHAAGHRHAPHHHASAHHRVDRHHVDRHQVHRHHYTARHHDAVRHHRLARKHHVVARRDVRHLTRRQKIDRVIAVARSQRGKPYVWGAAGPHAFDCSGYVQWVYRHALGVRLPKYTDTQYHATHRLRRGHKLRRGDLVFVRVGRHEEHVGIYAGHWRWWVAPHTGSHVKLQRIYPARHVFSRVIR